MADVDTVLEKFMEDDAGGGAGDGIKLQLAMMREQAAAAERRQEREATARREWFQSLITLFGPVVLKLFERAPDPLSHPLVAQLITNAGGGEQAKKMQDAMASTLRESSKIQMEAMSAAMQSASTMKDQMNEKLMETTLERIERMRDDDDGDDRGPLSGASDLLELIKGAKELLLPAPAAAVRPALPGPGSRPPVDQVDEGQGADDVDQVDEPDAPPAAARPNPLRLTLRAIRGYYLGKVPEAERASFLAKLVNVAGDAPAFKSAVIAGDEAAVLELVSPEISASPELSAWIQEPGVFDWLRQFAAEVLRPALSAPPVAIAAAKPAPRPPVRRPAARAAVAPRARRHVVLADDPLV